jgi:hypothetical protein
MAVHQLSALYFKLGEDKIFVLFNAAHFKWIGTSVNWYTNN